MPLPAVPILMTLPPDGTFDPAGFTAFAVLYAVLIAIFLAPIYILNALGLYSIASRRGICNSWLAWLPLGDAWILGRISDQYQVLVMHQQKKRSAILLILRSAGCIAYILTMVLFFTGLVSLEAHAIQTQFFRAVLPAVLFLPVGIGVSVAATVFTYLAKYDLFRSCDPKNAALYLAGSLIVKFMIPTLEILQPVFVLLCRKKDDGIPQEAQKNEEALL